MALQKPKFPDDRTNQTILNRINQIRRQVKRVELITTVVILFTCLLAFFLFSIILDHWIFKTGTPALLRVLLSITFLFFGAIFLIARVIPIVRFPVNPAYAADLMEKCHPELKNRLLNWIFLKREKRGKSETGPSWERHILEGIGHETAANLTRIQSELVVDIKQSIRWGTGLIVLLVFFLLYTIFSPKSLIDSIFRAANPFSRLDAPQSLVIKEVTPGDVTVFQGETIPVTARFDRATHLPVYLVYTTNDGRLVDQLVPMNSKGDGYHFETRFPPGKKGFEESLTYRVEVGTSRSKSWDVTVRPAIYLETKVLEYRFPEYTAMAPVRVENSGDVRALEGTEVSLQAESNVAMSRAELLFDGKPEQSVVMDISPDNPKKATVRFTLHLDPDHPEKQPYTFYTLRCRDEEKNINQQPIQYAVEIIRDQSPSIAWVNEEAIPTEIPLNSRLEFQVKTEDPDFALRHVRLHAGKIELATNGTGPEKQSFPVVELLEKPQSGTVTLSGEIVPQTLGLKVGDRVDYFVVALDTRLPQPNSTTTGTKTFTVVAPKENKENQKKEDRQQEHSPQEQSDNGQQNDKQQDNEQQNGKQQDHHSEKDKQDGSDTGESSRQNSEQDQGQDQKSGKQEQNQQENQGNQENKDGSGSQQGGQQGNNDQQQGGEHQGAQNSEENGSQNGKSDQSTGKQPDDSLKREKPVDGESNPGDVFREALERMKEKAAEDENIGKNTEKGGNTEEKEQKQKQQNQDVSENSSASKNQPRETTQDLKRDGEKTDHQQGTGNSSSHETGNGEKTEAGTPPDRRPEQETKDSQGGQTDAYDARQGDTTGKKEFDPSQNKQPIYNDPNDRGTSSAKDGASEDGKQNADKLGNMQNQMTGGSPDQKSEEKSSDKLEKGQQEHNTEGQKHNAEETGENNGKNDAGTSQGQSQNIDSNKNMAPGNQEPQDRQQQHPDQQRTSGGGNSPDRLQKDETFPETITADPNLEYTEKATDLVIDYLENELAKQKPDQELLNRLKWSKDDLAKFVNNWKQMQKQAQNAPQNSKESQDWVDTLKNIGPLSPKSNVGRTKTDGREFSTATEVQRYTPPPKFRDRAEVYTQGLSGRKEQ